MLECLIFLYYYGIKGKDHGHVVNVVGYCVVKINNKKTNYLIVADGWNNSERYIDFNDTAFKNKFGIYFNIRNS
jgi:hypothetical protein